MPLMLNYILLLSEEFSGTLGSPVQMALRYKVVPQYQTFNMIELFIIRALETPSPRVR